LIQRAWFKRNDLIWSVHLRARYRTARVESVFRLKIFIFSGEARRSFTVVRSPENPNSVDSGKGVVYLARNFARITNPCLVSWNRTCKSTHEAKTKRIQKWKNMIQYKLVQINHGLSFMGSWRIQGSKNQVQRISVTLSPLPLVSSLF
jgi:hypothetical protein